MKPKKHIVIIGGGLAGLVACYDLKNAGFHVTILESGSKLGGMASSVMVANTPIEEYYHFICRSDLHLLKLVDELGLNEKLHWNSTKTSLYYSGKFFPFSYVTDLLRFSAIPPLNRIQFGIHVLRSKYKKQWRHLDTITAKRWLIDSVGEKVFNTIWYPLLRIKFGDYYDKISAAWMWHRIWRVANSRRYLWEREEFGYLEEGSATLINKLSTILRSHKHVNIQTETAVKSIHLNNNKVISIDTDGTQIKCDSVISTVALPILTKLLDNSVAIYTQRIQQIQYIGIICSLIQLKNPFSENFWMNISDPNFMFNGIIEQTNLNKHLNNQGFNILYIPLYMSIDKPEYQFSDERLFTEYSQMLSKINPEFNENWIINYQVFRAPYAQAICATGFSNLAPEIRTPIYGLYVTDSSQFYPEDRTISAAIHQGRDAAKMVIDDIA